MNANKIDVSTVCEMFEKLSEKLDKQTTDKSAEPLQAIEKFSEPTKVEHRHTIDIASSKVFLSLIIMALMILGLAYAIGEQRRTISQYKNNDLKYRYIKMQGQTDEENLYRLEKQFRYGDSIKIIRKQVEKYEELIKEQVEKLERARRNSEEAERLQDEIKVFKAQR